MLNANVVGPKVFYLNPTSDKLSTANLAATDTAISDAISPYAYTATVRDDYDTFNFHTDDAGSVVAVGMRNAFGLFLTPENNKGNLLFQVSGKVILNGAGTTPLPLGAFFFGRRATSNTVVSDKTAPQNPLVAYTLLPSMHYFQSASLTSDYVETEVFSLQLAGGFVYCFGYYIQNCSGANALTFRGTISLSVRKYGSGLDIYTPTR